MAKQSIRKITIKRTTKATQTKTYRRKKKTNVTQTKTYRRKKKKR